MRDFFLGKVAVITGASRGIGYSIADELAAVGCRLALLSTNQDSIDKVGEELRSRYGIEVLPLQVDVKSSEEVNQAISLVSEKWGQIHFLINNAGITRDSLLIRMKSDDWDEVIDTNLKGCFHCAKSVCKSMMRSKEGVIVNITSVVGMMGNPGQANYSAAKAGVVGFTKTLARELAPRGIRVNAIAPGFIKSNMTEKIPDNMKEELKSRIPLGRFGETKAVADCVKFLLSPMANYITGSVIQVDGGMNM